MTSKEIIPIEIIEQRIFLIREQKVMLDAHLAELYGVATKVLLQTVKRKPARFPHDFTLQLTKHEYESLRSQFVTSKGGRGGRRYFPYAFTEQGVAMLSSVLRSERAIQMNVAIMSRRDGFATGICALKANSFYPQRPRCKDGRA